MTYNKDSLVQKIAKLEISSDLKQEIIKEVKSLEFAKEWHARRILLLQEAQQKMRDPERTMVCDIIANGHLLEGPMGNDRYRIIKD